MLGQVVGGRFLLREKTSHSPGAVQFAAHDMMGGIDVDLEVFPDGAVATGYRLGVHQAEANPRDLPNLYGPDFTERSALPNERSLSLWLRIWRVLSGRS